MIRLTFCRAAPISAGLLLAALVTLPAVVASAEGVEALDRNETRFNQVIHEIQSTIRANNRIADLEEAYFRGETLIALDRVDGGIRTRDLRGFELQQEILSIRLSL